MNKLKQILTASLLAAVLFAGNVMAQASKGVESVAIEQVTDSAQCGSCPTNAISVAWDKELPMNFAAQKACYVPELGVYAVIDSIDNCVDVHMRVEDTVMLAFRYYTDEMKLSRKKRGIYMGKGRHDLNFILRPVSVQVIAKRLVVLASSKTDSSYIAVLSLCPGHIDTAINDVPVKTTTIARVDFNCNAYGFGIDKVNNELMVVGKNALGYDFISLPIANGLDGIAEGKPMRVHYHVPKQSDRIKESDPHGFGLAGVAIPAVFLALCCIVLLLKLVTTIIAAFEKRGVKPAQHVDPDQEVYAAIAAAIHMYNEELHDEEPTVITIQKTERSWTPWNAKYISMNKYFNNR